MNHQRSPLRRLFINCVLVLVAAPLAFAQGDAPRQTVAITYPLEQAVNVKFRGTTRFPRLKGEAKVKRAGRRGTRVELSVENLPRALELGSVYTTYVLWAVTPEGRVDNLGEIKRSGSMIIDSKLDVTTPLQSFALMVTAELFQPAPAFIEPPRNSISSAICVAVRVFVPFVKSAAVIVAKPALSIVSLSAPLCTRS